MNDSGTASQIPIAIVGMSAIMPGSRDVAGFWRTIVRGRDHVVDTPATHWLVDDHYDADPSAPDKTYCRRGAFLPEIDFDPVAHGIPPNALEATDPAQLLALVAAHDLLADLRRNLGRGVSGERTGVILGSAGLSLIGTMDARLQRPVWLKSLREAGLPEDEAQEICRRIAEHYTPWQEASFPGLLANVVAGRIANRLDLHGVNCTIDAACASSLAALSAAVGELALGRADLMISGGVDAGNTPFMYVCFSKTPALSPTGDCRPFSADADGTLLGEGLGMVALKRLADAERDGDRIYAVLRGLGSSSDGKGGAIYAPVPRGQARALRQAYETAGYGPDTVELIEAHGTGTAAGDTAEFAALREVFGARDDRRNWCALGSVKSQIGHTKAAAGAAALIKAVLALQHGVYPPSIKIRRPNPALGIEDSPFYLSAQARPWVRAAGTPRRASCSSFGFGGSNFHVALEEYVPRGGGRRAALPRARSHELVLISGDDVAAVRARIGDLSALASLDEAARRSHDDFDPAEHVRLAVVATDLDDFRGQSTRAVEAIAADAVDPVDPILLCGISYETGGADPGSVAFLFPGQGAQYPGMGADVAMTFRSARAVWDRAAALDLGGEVPLHDVVFPKPAFGDEERDAQERRLADTRWAQPALAAHSLSLAAVLAGFGIRPDRVAGHSLGELVALHAAGVLAEADLLRLARRRGELMAGAAAATPGAMVALATGRAPAEALIAATGMDRLWVANHNHPGQTVVSGTAEAVAALEAAATAVNVASRRLAVSAAFHSPLVAAAAEPLLGFLAGVEIAPPRLDVYSNVDAAPYPADAELIRKRVAHQVAAPVDFAAEIEALYAAGTRVFVDVGARAAVTGMVRAVLDGRPHLAVSLDRRGRNGVASLLGAVGRLAVHGVPVVTGLLWEDCTPDPDPEPVREPAMRVPLTGAAFGHRYPPADAAALPPPNPPRTPRPVLPVLPVLKEKVTSMDGQDPWLTTIAEAQRQTTQAHAAFQDALLASHQAFLQMAENTIARLAGVAVPGDAEAAPPRVPPQALSPAHETSQPVPAAAVHPAPVQVVVPPELTLNIDLLLEILAEKTGYPVELLGADMDLESELGVDSIKKVEILSEVRSRVPGLPTSDSPAMAELFKARTLTQILDRASGYEPSSPGLDDSGQQPFAEPSKADSLRRLVPRLVADPARGFAMAGLESLPVTVVDGGSGLGEAVAARLRGYGIEAASAAATTCSRAVVHLGGLVEQNGPDEARRVLREAFVVARIVAPAMERHGGLFVTVQDTGGRFGLGGGTGRAWFAGLAGLTRTAGLEWPLAAVKAVDLERAGRDADSLARAIVAELRRGGPTSDVGLTADGGRYTIVVGEEEAPPPGTSAFVAAGPLGADAVLVVAGGARGIAAAALRRLAEAAPGLRLAILGRTALVDEPADLVGALSELDVIKAIAARGETSPATPAEMAAQSRAVLAAREVRKNLAALEAGGARVRYLPVDVTDAGAVEAAVAEVRAVWGPVTGIVHAAGVLADKRIADKTGSQFDRVVAVKVDGLRSLLAATAEDPLRLICLFSSVAARFGNPGQCDYAAANEILNQAAVAERAARPGCLVRSIAWGPWDGGMVTPALAAHFAEQAVPLIPLSAGADAFVAELNRGPQDVQVVISAGDGPMAPKAPTRAVVGISAEHRKVFADHAIVGTPVLPLAMALEWLSSFAAALLPRERTIDLMELAVLRRVDLDDPSLILAVEGSWTEPDRLTLRLLGDGSTPHYRAHVVRAGRSGAGRASWSPPATTTRLDPAHLYDSGTLFHGPAFQVLRGVVNVGSEGATARVVGARALGWPADLSLTGDPAAVDGAMQLAGLWAGSVLGSAALPMQLTEFRLHKSGPLDSESECRVRGVRHSDDRAVSDAVILDASGNPRIELLGITHVKRPDISGFPQATA